VLRRCVDILRRQPHLGRFLVSRALMYTGLSTRFIIPKAGFRLRFFPTNSSAQQWVDPYHDNDADHGHREETFFRRYLRPGDVVVDVGANFGLTALAAFSAVGSGGEVHAFEPHPRIFSFLVGNIELNGAQEVVTPYNLAIGERAGTAYLTDMRADDQNGVSPGATGLRVAMSTLDDAASRLASIALLKIDVEGYEPFVLRGATQTLARTACVYFESSDEKLAQHGSSLGEIVELLAGHGFQVRRLGGAAPTTAVTAAYGSSQLEDLVAVCDVGYLHRRLTGSAPTAGGASAAADQPALIAGPRGHACPPA